MSVKRIFTFLFLSNMICVINAQAAFVNQPSVHGINVVCGDTYLGNGISFFDYDNDGWDDITIATVAGDAIRFMKNINGNFVEQNLNILNNDKQNKQINWVDIDNDGDNDLFVTSDVDGLGLYENTGNMNMVDISAESGMMPDIFPYYGASWGDYNNDGYLDVFISIRDLVIPNILYKNNGDNTFTLINAEAGLLTNGYFSFCSAFLDYDNDGDQDIYVANDKQYIPNLMYRNNGDGTFTEVGQITGTDIAIDAMTVTVDDYDSDGWLDIYVTNDDSDSALLKNNGNGTFTDAGAAAGVTFNSIGWGAIFLDADNDRDLDLYVCGETNGALPNYLSSAFYNSKGNGTFDLIQDAIPNDFSENYSSAIGDVDNDGYPEFVVNNTNHSNISLWKNNTVPVNNWLKVKLEGTISNRMGVGAFIELSTQGEKQYRYTLCGEGYLSQNSATEVIGLGHHTVIDYMKIRWLSGIEDIFYNVSANQTLHIAEGGTLSINQFSQENRLVYQNPFTNVLHIESPNTITSCTIYSIQGNEILNKDNHSPQISLNTSFMLSGIYLVKLKFENDMAFIKVIKP